MFLLWPLLATKVLRCKCCVLWANILWFDPSVHCLHQAEHDGCVWGSRTWRDTTDHQTTPEWWLRGPQPSQTANQVVSFCLQFRLEETYSAASLLHVMPLRLSSCFGSSGPCCRPVRWNHFIIPTPNSCSESLAKVFQHSSLVHASCDGEWDGVLVESMCSSQCDNIFEEPCIICNLTCLSLI
jgi:hypothetical protein